MPVVSDDQVRHPSALQPLTAYRWFIEYGALRHRTGERPDAGTTEDAGSVAPGAPCEAYLLPTLFVVSPEDEMSGCKPTVVRDAYDKLAGPKERIEIDGGHFGLLYFPSEEFERASSAQARFRYIAFNAGVPRRGLQINTPRK
jgi:hypothetical protein